MSISLHIGGHWRGASDVCRWAALRFMKNAIIIGVMSATIVMVGCSKKPSSSSTTLPPGGKPVAVSDGGNKWFVGAVIINGTNVSDTNVTIRVRTEASK
jgi:hypothetical protein